MSRERAVTPHRLAIGLPVRNVAAYLPQLLDVLIEVASACTDVRVVMAENDSDDATAELAATLVKLDRRVSLLRFPELQQLVPKRTDRLAFLRNSIVEELVSLTDREDGWTLVMLDADDVTSALTSAQVLELVEFLHNHPEYCGATANSQPVYYDVWTLRCDGWSPDDCWARVLGRPKDLSLAEATRTFVAARQRPIDPMQQPVAVASAFGGLAAYHLADVAQCRYRGHASSGEPCSDHVPMNAELTELTGKPLAIVPSVNLIAPTEHIVESQLSGQSHGFLGLTKRALGRAASLATACKRTARTLVMRSGIARRWGHTRQFTQRRAIDEYRLFMGADHAVPKYAEEFRAYERPVRSIGIALRRAHGRRIRAIDVGANIGDTTVALVVAVGADVLAIEGDDRYLGALRDNTAPIADRVTIFSGFVTSDGAAIETLALGNVLTKAGWDEADLLKSNTDGHDFEIVQAALAFPWIEQPVLFFKFDPSLDDGRGAEAGLAVVEEALLRGYRRWYVLDNFGNLLGQIENDQVTWFRNLVSYLARCREAGGGLLYVDVAAFCDHHPLYDGAVGATSR